ncbi:MAG: hypothetical protein IJI07_05840 [Flexilinea sp.]|nr:hypothetical protein [Flexilinea sp.]
MRTNEERIAALHGRVSQLKQERKNRQFAAICSVSGAVCLGFLLGMAVLMQGVSNRGFIDGASDAMNASIFTDSGSLAYVVIAILAFLLGITVTVFCFRMKKWLDEKDHGDH